MEERILKGDLGYESSMPRLAGDEERFVLLAMHQTLVERVFSSPSGRKKIAQRFIAGFPGGKGDKSRQGRKKARGLPDGFFRPYGASIGLLGVVPSDESLGYCRSSLTGLLRG